LAKLNFKAQKKEFIRVYRRAWSFNKNQVVILVSMEVVNIDKFNIFKLSRVYIIYICISIYNVLKQKSLSAFIFSIIYKI
jgi:hypothetical protein